MNPLNHPDPGSGDFNGTRVAWFLVVLTGFLSIAAAIVQRPNLDTDAGTCILAA